ncbi:MAG: SMC-Scp complex subunit ScpB [Coriobacteriales bacterium]|nr:SMC-Scp complex subunit ScpB [Coriobacteriales bacterium]
MENEKLEFNIKSALEAMLFVSEDALKEKQVAPILDCDEDTIKQAFELLQGEYEQRESGIVLKKTAAGWKLYSHPMYHEQLSQLILSWDSRKLSQAALETLSIIAYNQPVTRNAISAVRGVNSDGPVSSLADKGLVAEAGKLESGALLYKTTQKFLQEFGLTSIKDLPPLSEFAVDQSTIDILRARLGFSEEYMNALENAEFFADEDDQNFSNSANVDDEDEAIDELSASSSSILNSQNANAEDFVDAPVSNKAGFAGSANNAVNLDNGNDNNDDDDDDDENLDDIIKESITAKADEGIEFVD